MIVPANMDLSTRSHGPAQLSVTAGGGENPSSVTLPLPIRPARYLTRLWLDRRSYRAGETVFFRSLTVSRYSLAAAGTLPLEFEILDAKPVPLPDSRIDGLTDHGVGNGLFRLPDTLPAGTYTLVARTWDEVSPEERSGVRSVGPACAAFSSRHEVCPRRLWPWRQRDRRTAPQAARRHAGAGVSLQVAAKVGDRTIFQKIAKADAGGKLRVEFALPRQLQHGHGRLIVEIEGGDQSGTISEEIPMPAALDNQSIRILGIHPRS